MAKPSMPSAVLNPRRVALLSVLIAGAALLIAACGGSPNNSAVAHLATTTTLAASSHGSGSPSGNSSGSARGSGSGGQEIAVNGGNEADALAYAQCMRTHGVPNFPDPNAQGGFSIQGSPGSGLDPGSASFQAADKACRRHLPNGGQMTPAQQAKAMAQALKFSQCMRTHGITDFPDPQSGPGGGIAIRIRAGQGSDLNPQNSQFQAAQNACQGITGFGPGAKRTSSSKS